MHGNFWYALENSAITTAYLNDWKQVAHPGIRKAVFQRRWIKFEEKM